MTFALTCHCIALFFNILSLCITFRTLRKTARLNETLTRTSATLDVNDRKLAKAALALPVYPVRSPLPARSSRPGKSVGSPVE